MDKLNTELTTKPDNIDEYDLIAILGVYDIPQIELDFINPPFSKSEIAFNESSQKVQVYVTSKTEDGIDKFIEAYPDSDIKEDSTLENPDDWKVIAYPSESMPDESTALDNYFQVRGREYITKKIKELNNSRGI